jgi:hypothetical protein
VRPGNVYVVSADDPAHGAGAPYSRVVFARSADKGATWSFAQPDGMLAPVGGDSFQLFPTAAIDPFGDIVAAWYDNRRGLTNSHGQFLLDVFATYSTDGGLSWAPPFQVNAAANPFDPDPGALDRFLGPPATTRIGEYFGIALFGGTAYLAWNGNSFRGSTPAAPQQVWFSSFAISGALTVLATSGDHTFTVRSIADNPDFVEVLVDGRPEYVGLWSALTGITIAATAGNDTVNIEDTAAGVPVMVNLGDGPDVVKLGGNGLGLLIAGAPPSTLLGGTDENILIVGTTIYDGMTDRLRAVMDCRMGMDNYEAGVFDPTHRIGVALMDATMVTGDGSGNAMAGDPGRDWFYGNLALDPTIGIRRRSRSLRCESHTFDLWQRAD